MTVMIRIMRLLALGVVAVGAAGCATPLVNGGGQSLSPQERFPITVEPQVVTMAVSVDDGMQRLAPGESDRVRAFAERWKARGQGMINAAAPVGSSNRAAAKAGLDEVKRILRAAGVQTAAVNVSSYRADNDPRAPITLSFVTLAATAAECGVDWSENLGWTPRNMPWPDFGCTSQHNFAAMVADPRDLIEPRTSDPADAARRSQVLDNHRKGIVTQSQRNADDTGIVSTVSR
jgi:pilus assembly protein CpaD